jgi:hypothetical protein
MGLGTLVQGAGRAKLGSIQPILVMAFCGLPVQLSCFVMLACCLVVEVPGTVGGFHGGVVFQKVAQTNNGRHLPPCLPTLRLGIVEKKNPTDWAGFNPQREPRREGESAVGSHAGELICRLM